jgi:hypothetical protein
LEVRNGTFVLSPGGTLVVDLLVITNVNGRFIKGGGTFQAANIILAPDFDADGDGQSNSNESRAGTDPLDPNSLFRAVAVTPINSTDLRLDWTTVAGYS